MLQGNASFDATLAAAAGEDDALASELRRVFIESVQRQIDLLERARCDGNWNVAATRLRGLGLTFHATELTALAQTALDGAPGDPAVRRELREWTAQFASQ